MRTRAEPAEPVFPLELTAAAALAPEEAARRLGSAPIGLSAAEAAARLAVVGPNALRSHGARPLTVLLRQLRNPLLVLLLAAALTSLLVGEHADALIVFAISGLSVGLGFVNEYRSERAVEELHSRLRHTALALRDGVPAPVDLRLLEVEGLECDEAVLTGEPLPAEKRVAPVGAPESPTPRSPSSSSPATAAPTTIGLQALSGALERGHRFLFVCYDNEAYMNTGVQRSGATPFGASTTTSPAGAVGWGKAQQRKDMTAIAVAHHVPYVAQAAATHWFDLSEKAERAAAADGPAFLNVLTDCPVGWQHEPRLFAEVIDTAVDCLFWPLYEVVDGVHRLTYVPPARVPVRDWLALQGRFAHLLRPENAGVVEDIQLRVMEDWEALVERCGDRIPAPGAEDGAATSERSER